MTTPTLFFERHQRGRSGWWLLSSRLGRRSAPNQPVRLDPTGLCRDAARIGSVPPQLTRSSARRLLRYHAQEFMRMAQHRLVSTTFTPVERLFLN